MRKLKAAPHPVSPSVNLYSGAKTGRYHLNLVIKKQKPF